MKREIELARARAVRAVELERAREPAGMRLRPLRSAPATPPAGREAESEGKVRGETDAGFEFEWND
jgi:hypothetical protein